MDTFGGGVVELEEEGERWFIWKPYLYCLVCYNKHWFFYLKKKSNKIIKSYRHEQTFLLPKEISLDEEWGDLITP